MRTELLDGSSAPDVSTAVRILLAGGLVAVPTETVYGLGADASNDGSVAKVFAVKGRPSTHPLIVHVADAAHARALASRWTAAAEVLSRTFWPGPLSLLVERAESVPDAVTGGRDTVVVRVPDSAATLRVLSGLHAGGSIGLAAPSANRFGAISPTSARHVLDDFNGEIEAVLDGGSCGVGVESTIVDCRGTDVIVLRPGGLPTEAIAEALHDHGITVGRASGSEAIAPGMLRSHYAPRKRLEVFGALVDLLARRDALEAAGTKVSVVEHPDDVFEYSRGLYTSLRTCDADESDVILALLPAGGGLGEAVRDRLLKASADR